MTQWLEVNDWLDLAANAWIGVVLIAVAAVPSWYARRNHSTLKSVQDQVVNGHTQTNLRDDIDRAIAAVTALGDDVRNLRRDLLAEEEHRRVQVADLRDEIEHRTAKHRRLP